MRIQSRFLWCLIESFVQENLGDAKCQHLKLNSFSLLGLNAKYLTSSRPTTLKRRRRVEEDFVFLGSCRKKNQGIA